MVRKVVRGYILENFLFSKDEGALNDDDSMLDKGVLDSTSMLEVIMFLESEFSIKVDDEDMIPANLETVSRIVSYVERKRAVTA